MPVHPIPALSDNYIWVYQSPDLNFIVDPGEAQPVLDYIQDQNIRLDAILLTHNHDDHTGGVREILAQIPDLPVYGPQETADFNSVQVAPMDTITLKNHKLAVYLTAGHTSGHISYLIDDKNLFCGDSLFMAGCGRVFTGDYHAEFETLQLFAAMEGGVQVFAGHEYTQTNLAFAQTVNLDDEEFQANVKALSQQVDRRIQAGFPSLPSTIAIELNCNPFMRASSVDTFKALRDLRDNF
ncbi:hydroxyacylglutathione hydrolase [Eremococcus coleocola]|uniref:Hydroxyacylglutathione hydrolase n=1 Tax=Eremococcus coleocola ACS-139-V-Col8 TaxID=908337 RepID=E4KPS9_9LACT|nr:hydroxyacylglutathione hydrolase [Eremococcus coleocola]EFR31018.1 hydroxyacylglutathione hydrolase [Eremococcus coleocola ACS-139-V-Col8]